MKIIKYNIMRNSSDSKRINVKHEYNNQDEDAGLNTKAYNNDNSSFKKFQNKLFSIFGK